MSKVWKVDSNNTEREPGIELKNSSRSQAY